MKKILSALLVVAMIASMCAVFSLPAAAASGDFFDTHGKASHEVPGYDGDINSIPGYEYTDDGFHMTTADWTTGKPFSHVSTVEKVDLKQGFYMQVRIDEFEYKVSDTWFNFNIWSKPSIDEGTGDTQYGTGVQSLIRPNTKAELSNIQWYINAFDDAGNSSIAKDYNGKDENGNNILTLVITYDDDNGYNVTINGSQAHKKVIEYMNKTYAEDSWAHIGFTMYSGSAGGSQSATILWYGESEDTKTKPDGYSSKEPENYVIKYEPIKDASSVPAGQPAVIMSGDKANSDLKGTPLSNTGSIVRITEDGLVHIVATKGTGDCGVWEVKNNVSYDIKDFPVVMVITKNYCSEGAGPGECFAYEEAALYLATGDEVVINRSNRITGILPEEKAYFIGEDSYLAFIHDVSADLKTEENPDGKFEGRINATRFDMVGVDLVNPGANEFDIVMQCFFKTEEDARAYAEAYFTSEGWEGHPDEETDPKVENTETESESESESETETDAKTESKAPATDDNASSGGCSGTVGFGAIAIVAIAAVAGFVTLKKKD